ncbi:VPDSG-CTERM sorting domain-containing protein [Pelagicoccus enzymogenes]|uniref:VPDSG-CTERM sorting domain-containing protein n=1 Tax=Pelagicoccus enzymogenes TaxID=2773457 RepID=UPI00280DBF2F|nr:VPDSG-CTERM sorting domain-containing protein [Pelagicoccus enzymogenes]MDQ8200684.1 VPDSG-CTERM sorting domain-containing protein [Pelagicoccus enzymogenes]
MKSNFSIFLVIASTALMPSVNALNIVIDVAHNASSASNGSGSVQDFNERGLGEWDGPSFAETPDEKVAAEGDWDYDESAHHAQLSLRDGEITFDSQNSISKNVSYLMFTLSETVDYEISGNFGVAFSQGLFTSQSWLVAGLSKVGDPTNPLFYQNMIMERAIPSSFDIELGQSYPLERRNYMVGSLTGTLLPGQYEFSWEEAVSQDGSVGTSSSSFEFLLKGAGYQEPDSDNTAVPDSGATLTFAALGILSLLATKRRLRKSE